VIEYQRALTLDPSLNRIHYVLGRLYRRQGKTELAENEFRVFERNENIERAKHVSGLSKYMEGAANDGDAAKQ
jgi:hypothetical protein